MMICKKYDLLKVNAVIIVAGGSGTRFYGINQNCLRFEQQNCIKQTVDSFLNTHKFLLLSVLVQPIRLKCITHKVFKDKIIITAEIKGRIR